MEVWKIMFLSKWVICRFPRVYTNLFRPMGIHPSLSERFRSKELQRREDHLTEVEYGKLRSCPGNQRQMAQNVKKPVLSER